MVTTFFKGLRSTSPEKVTDLSEIINGIKDGQWKTQVLRCREDISKKDRLPCFTPTGKFNHRSIKGLEEYNGVICLDIDHVEDPESLKKKASALPWVMAAFITPSGKGLKVIAKTSAVPETFKAVEEQVAESFQQATGHSRDKHCKDIARIQFISYDPDLYYNPQSITFTP